MNSLNEGRRKLGNNLQELCRACLKSAHSTSPASSDEDNTHKNASYSGNSLLLSSVRKLFLDFTALDISKESESFPKQLCQLCLTRLRDFECFRKEVLNNTDALSKIIAQKEANADPQDEAFVKTERVYSDDDDDDKLDTMLGESSMKSESDYSDYDDDDDNKLLLPELANMPINIKTEPNFEVTDSQYILPTFEELDGTIKAEASNSDDYSDNEEILTPNEAASNIYASASPDKSNSHKTVMHCSVCNKEFRSKMLLEAHVVRKHLGQEKSFDCPNCSATFKRYNDLNLHILANHTNHIKEVLPRCRYFEPNGGYHCKICNRSYCSSRALTDHLKRHNKIKEHVCKECGVTKVTRSELKIHMRVHNPNLEKFRCPQCPQEFNFKNAISRHIKVVHEGLKRFPCQYCPKRFATSNSRMCHERLHTGERPFKCELCEKTFAQPDSLRSHMKNHDKNLRKHVCSYCSQRFITLKNLKDHEKRHLSDKPHICTVCNKGYYKAEDLQMHRLCHDNAHNEAEKHTVKKTMA